MSGWRDFHAPRPTDNPGDLTHMLVVFTGPGLKPANEATRDYLEQVAIQYARGLANGSVKKTPRKKNLQESKYWITAFCLLRLGNRNEVKTDINQTPPPPGTFCLIIL